MISEYKKHMQKYSRKLTQGHSSLIKNEFHSKVVFGSFVIRCSVKLHFLTCIHNLYIFIKYLIIL